VTPQNWRAQIITCEKKLPKNSKKKTPCWRGKLEGTINTLKRRAQKNYAQNKTSENLQKIAKVEGRVGGDNKYPIGGHK
jgi:hypothetical protein